MKFFLVGSTGVGKSYFAKLWAESFGLPYFDVDKMVEVAEGKTIEDIFKTGGAAAFREMEASALRSLETVKNGIIACGGGAPCYYGNMDWMNEHGTTIWLNFNIETIIKNLLADYYKRPLLQMPEEEWPVVLQEMLEQRKEYYEQARYRLTEADLETELFTKIFTENA